MIDIGVNLTASAFAGRTGSVIADARSAGVQAIIGTGTSVDNSRATLEFAAAHPGFVHATAGVHPHRASGLDGDGLRQLTTLLQRDEVVAVGECGLDYNRDFSPRADQRIAFGRQIELALTIGKPLFLHERDAHGDFAAMLREVRGRVRGVVHCFTGGLSEAEAYLDLGLDIGITGWVADERRNESLLHALPHIPRERLHLETDAPYLVPRTMARPRPSVNLPQYLVHVASAVADVRDEEVCEVAAYCTANSRRMFGV